MSRQMWTGWALLLGLWLAGGSPATAQPVEAVENGEMVQLDFNDVELSVVIDTIARLTRKNFIYDDRVRGRVTIVSPTKITVEEAYAVFESVLQVKGFTTVLGPGGAIKVIPLREAKESNVETVRSETAPPVSDRFITRLIPLKYIDAEAIAETLKPLVSKDASLVSYAPTNTVILTDAATNISRILSIVESIDVETFKEELSVIPLEHADAGTMAQQLSEIFGAEVAAASSRASRLPTRSRRGSQAAQTGTAELAAKGQVRIITDERTNSLLVLASRQRTVDIRKVVARLDVPVRGGGRIQVYRLRYADAEELANTISALLSGQPAPSGSGLPSQVGSTLGGVAQGAGGSAQTLRSSVTELAGGVTVTADPPTNSLLIQGSQEGYNTLLQVIEQLDIPRPQVLVEALIMEVDVTDAIDLGFRGLIRASATVNGTNILSAPHVLTLDNEEAEIKVGDNIPIISSRVQSAAGINAVAREDGGSSLATSQNIERQDIGITLRVTPQISEGDTLRLEIFQEVTAVNLSLSFVTGDPEEVGVALSNRRIENVVTVADEETVVIGGLIDEIQQDTENKVPWLGDIPVLGWLFKTTGDSFQKRNLLVFLTPHIIRNQAQHARETIRKREEFWASSEESAPLSDKAREDSERRLEENAAEGLEERVDDPSPVRSELKKHRARYPVELMRELERGGRSAPAAARDTRWGVLAATFADEDAAASTLGQLIEAGHDGALLSEEREGILLYQVVLGPFASEGEADRAAAVIRDRFSFSPRVYEGDVNP